MSKPTIESMATMSSDLLEETLVSFLSFSEILNSRRADSRINELCENDRFWNTFFTRNSDQIAPVFLLAREYDKIWFVELLQSHPGFKPPVYLYKDIYSVPKLYLTAGKVREMNDGEKTRFLCLDRNFWDLVHSGKDMCLSEVMFGSNYIVDFTKVGGMDSIRGTFTWNYENFKVIDGIVDDRPFDFSTDGKRWVPWIRQERRDHPNDLRYWTNIDVGHYVVEDDYFLGWRGPMIKWDTITERFPLIVNDKSQAA